MVSAKIMKIMNYLLFFPKIRNKKVFGENYEISLFLLLGKIRQKKLLVTF